MAAELPVSFQANAPTTIGDHVNAALADPATSPELLLALREWKEVNKAFTAWIFDFAKHLSVEGMLPIAEQEEAVNTNAILAWEAYATDRNDANESLFTRSLEAMNRSRRQLMKGSGATQRTT